MRELVFDVTQDADGGFCAEAIGQSIFTQADSREELRANVRDTTEGCFFDQADKPNTLRLYFRRHEVLPLAALALLAP